MTVDELFAQFPEAAVAWDVWLMAHGEVMIYQDVAALRMPAYIDHYGLPTIRVWADARRTRVTYLEFLCDPVPHWRTAEESALQGTHWCEHLQAAVFHATYPCCSEHKR